MLGNQRDRASSHQLKGCVAIEWAGALLPLVVCHALLGHGGGLRHGELRDGSRAEFFSLLSSRFGSRVGRGWLIGDEVSGAATLRAPPHSVALGRGARASLGSVVALGRGVVALGWFTWEV